MVVAEQYPTLRANSAFQDLRVQLEGTENRITVARNRYIKTVADYNVLARSFPTNLTAMVFGYKVKPTLHGAERGADLDAADRQLRQAGIEVIRLAPHVRDLAVALVLGARRRRARRRTWCRCRRCRARSSTRPAR